MTANTASASTFTPRPRPPRYHAALNIARDVMDLYRATLATPPDGRDHFDILIASFRAAGWGPCEAEDIPVDLVFSICAALAKL